MGYIKKNTPHTEKCRPINPVLLIYFQLTKVALFNLITAFAIIRFGILKLVRDRHLSGHNVNVCGERN